MRAVIAGGGVLGTWHALELCRAGFTVDHLEADVAPRGASVRNFGLLWVSGRSDGGELEAAQRARRRWEELGADVPGLGFRANGSLTVALHDGERATMQAFAARPDAAARGTRWIGPDAVREVNPAVRGEVAGGLHCEQDAAVEPRQVLPALRDYLTERFAYAFHPGCRVVGLDGRAVLDATGARWEGEVVVLTTGADYALSPACAGAASRLRKVRLQMLQTAPFSEQVPTSVADADTLRYYPAYQVVALDALGAQSSLAAEHRMQLLLVQRADGGLTIGDTHAYDEPFAFDLDEAPSLELVSRAERILGRALPPVVRRWEGVYAQTLDGGVCTRLEVTPGVWLVTGPGGRGMTCAPAIAMDTLAAAGVVGVAA